MAVKHHLYRPRHHMLRRKRPYEEIDPAVRPLVDSLNAVQGISTIASCEGHWYRKPPYVYFRAPVHLAALIEKRLREDAMNSHPKLAGNWLVEGRFDNNCSLAFCLYAPDYHRIAESDLAAFWLFGVRRLRIDKELLALAHLVKEAMLADIRDTGKPEISDGAAYDNQEKGVL